MIKWQNGSVVQDVTWRDEAVLRWLQTDILGQRTHSCLLRKMFKLSTLTFPLLEIVRIVLFSHVWISGQRKELIGVIQKHKLAFYYTLSLNIYVDFCTIQVVTLCTSPRHLSTVFSLHLSCPACTVLPCQSLFYPILPPFSHLAPQLLLIESQCPKKSIQFELRITCM